MYYIYSIATTAAVAQWVRAYSPQVEDWVFEYKPRQIKVVKTGSDSPTAKRELVTVINGCLVSQKVWHA